MGTFLSEFLAVSSFNAPVAHPLFEGSDLVIGQGISLCDDGNEVDLVMQFAHELDIDRSQSVDTYIKINTTGAV